MPRPTEPVKRVCYADDITVWASGVQIPVLEQQIKSYLEEMSTFLKDNSLLISAPKSTVTLFTPDPFQARLHPKIAIADAILSLERTLKILGVLLDTSFAFHHHCEYVANRVSKRNNILKALAGTSWGQHTIGNTRISVAYYYFYDNIQLYEPLGKALLFTSIS